MAQPFAVGTGALDELTMISTPAAVDFRCNLDFESFEFYRLFVHNLTFIA